MINQNRKENGSWAISVREMRVQVDEIGDVKDKSLHNFFCLMFVSFTVGFEILILGENKKRTERVEISISVACPSMCMCFKPLKNSILVLLKIKKFWDEENNF